MKAARWLVVLLFALSPALALADRTWLGLFLQGRRIGYSSYLETRTDDGRVTESKTVIDGKLLGESLRLSVAGQTWFGPDGAPVRMTYRSESGGRTLLVESEFAGSMLRVVSTFEGKATSLDVPIPTDAPVEDDPIRTVLARPGPGGSRPFYLFDPNTLAFVRCEAVVRGTARVAVDGREVDATHVEVRDPRAPLQVYLSAKGDLIKAVGPFGIEMRPEDEETATQTAGGADLAVASRIVPDRPLPDFEQTRRLRVRVDGADLSRLPSDAHQTVREERGSWIVETHPPAPPTGEGAPAHEDLKWLAPEPRIPVGADWLREVVAEVARDSPNLPETAERLRLHVLRHVRANAGIGVLRDAQEVYDSAEGVCRDHAILLTALLRTANIPARLASGLVYGDGAFYYHAWVEARLDQEWYGLDSTRTPRRIDATHIKVAHGSVAEAFSGFLLDGARITVLSSE